MDTEQLREPFEQMARDSFGLKRSRKGNYRNPAIARDWKWFQAGAHAAHASFLAEMMRASGISVDMEIAKRTHKELSMATEPIMAGQIPSLVNLTKRCLAENPGMLPEIAQAFATLAQAAYEEWTDWQTKDEPEWPCVIPLNPAEFGTVIGIACNWGILR